LCGKPLNPTIAIERPLVTAASNDTTSKQLNITFTAKGANINNGFVWFYTSSKAYIGSFGYFVSKSGTQSADLTTASSAWNSDGATDTLTIPYDSIYDDDGNLGGEATLATIKNCEVIVMDGAQFAPTSYTNYDYRAISEMGAVVIK
jgi:hypothetical protein